ncbi:MAG: hypothetical protein ACP5QH_07935, partial [Thermoplasmata archaeon]
NFRAPPLIIIKSNTGQTEPTVPRKEGRGSKITYGMYITMDVFKVFEIVDLSKFDTDQMGFLIGLIHFPIGLIHFLIGPIRVCDWSGRISIRTRWGS